MRCGKLGVRHGQRAVVLTLFAALGAGCDRSSRPAMTHSAGYAAGGSGANAAGAAGVAVGGQLVAGGPAAPSRPAAAAGGGIVQSGPTYSRVWDEIIVAKGCGSTLCHGAGQGGLMMDTRESAYASLVDVPAAGSACGSSGRMRVKSGDPDASLILDKMSHATPACGVTMPVAAKLEPNCTSPSPTVCTRASELSLLRDWIAAGAPSD